MAEEPRTKKCLCILGMHRSGTSCLTGSLEQSGVYLGRVSEKNIHNRKGNRENARFRKLNDQLLKHNGGDWSHPVEIRDWTPDMTAQRDRIISNLARSADLWWAFKDPRTLFTLDFWCEGIQDLCYVATFRHPLSVSNSLHARGNIAVEEGLTLWCRYNKKLLSVIEDTDIPLINFDVDDSSYEAELRALLQHLELPIDTDFFDPSLRHQSDIAGTTVSFSTEVEKIYMALLDHWRTQKNDGGSKMEVHG